MARVKRGITVRRRHKKILKLARGFYGAKHRWFKLANQYVVRALAAAYRDRRQRKRDFRRLWIARINAAAGVTINRKVLADLAVTDGAAFAGLVAKAKEVLKP